MSPVAIVYVVLICGLIPYAALKSARAVNGGAKMPGFGRHVVMALLTQAYMVAIALYAAYSLDFLRYVLPPARFEWRFVWVGLVALAVTLGTLPIRRRFVSDRLKQRSYARMPHNGRQVAAWALVALAAGFCEEVVYRGVLFNILDYNLGGWWPAAIIASAAFAIAHIIQGWFVAACIFLFALGFHAMVWYCGDLYTAMIVHFAYDLAIGIIVGFFLKPQAAEVDRAAAPA
jgi:membrane protease YdiL (CAAX protease family)